MRPSGMPSAEGPNTTKSPQRYSFRTYPPLRIEEAQCGWGSECKIAEFNDAAPRRT